MLDKKKNMEISELEKINVIKQNYQVYKNLSRGC